MKSGDLYIVKRDLVVTPYPLVGDGPAHFELSKDDVVMYVFESFVEEYNANMPVFYSSIDSKMFFVSENYVIKYFQSLYTEEA